jgi:hypothetical protein
MGRNKDMMAEINAKISMVVQMNFSLNLEIDSLGTKMANMTLGCQVSLAGGD